MPYWMRLLLRNNSRYEANRKWKRVFYINVWLSLAINGMVPESTNEMNNLLKVNITNEYNEVVTNLLNVYSN